jgi:hypothetical protein
MHAIYKPNKFTLGITENRYNYAGKIPNQTITRTMECNELSTLV